MSGRISSVQVCGSNGKTTAEEDVEHATWKVEIMTSDAASEVH